VRAWLTPDAPSGDTTRRVLVIPVEFLSSVNGALEELTEAENWEQYGALTPDQAAAAMRVMVDEYYMSQVSDDNPTPMGTLPIPLALTGSSSAVFTVDGSQIHNGYWSVGAPAIGNKWLFKISGRDGDEISIGAIAELANSLGILKVNLDGVTIGAFDLYSGAVSRNQKLIFGSGTISGDGWHDIELIRDTKNPSSSGYNMRLSELTYRMSTP